MDNIPGEVWRPITGYEGLYEVSNMGRVKSVARRVYCPCVLGDGDTRAVPERILKNDLRNQYYSATLNKDGKAKVFRVHRLVASAFIGEAPSPTHQINHIDGNKLNNVVSNLEWVTPKENTEHAIRTGLRAEHESEETKEKKRIAGKLIWENPEYKKAHSERMLELWQDPEYRARTLSNMRGKIRTPEQRAHYAAVVKETRPVLDIDTGEVFPSRRAAAERYGRTPEAIGQCIYGKSKTCAGHRWRYADGKEQAI